MTAGIHVINLIGGKVRFGVSQINLFGKKQVEQIAVVVVVQLYAVHAIDGPAQRAGFAVGSVGGAVSASTMSAMATMRAGMDSWRSRSSME
jgi:hypothetical protein